MRYQFKIHLLSKIILNKNIIQISQIIHEFERIESRKIIFKIWFKYQYEYLSHQINVILLYIFY